MKKVLIILSFILLSSSIQIQAQTDYYTADGVALSELDQDLVAASFLQATFGARNITFYVQINYGQDCIMTNGVLRRQKFIRNCSGLLDQEGEPILVRNYMKGLNLLEKEGWELVTVAVDTNMKGSSEPESHQYIFRRKEGNSSKGKS
ncbi:MAG: hypothetical protein AAFR87_33380 [Bacteroidota bacterium]